MTSINNKQKTSDLTDYVQVDCSVVMQIVRHVETEIEQMTLAAGGMVQGYLTGLVNIDEKGNRVEVTKCFPTASNDHGLAVCDDNTAALRDIERKTKLCETLENLSRMNFDYALVGIYQASPYGAAFEESLIENLHGYQEVIEQCVALVYDPVRTQQGKLSLRAFRLSKEGMEVCRRGEWSPSDISEAGLTFKNLFTELPVVVKNSRLTNVFLAQLETPLCVGQNDLGYRHGVPSLQLSSLGALEKCSRILLKDTDGMLQSVTACRKYRRFGVGYGLMDTLLNLSQTVAHADYISRTVNEDQAKITLIDLLATDAENTWPLPKLGNDSTSSTTKERLLRYLLRRTPRAIITIVKLSQFVVLGILLAVLVFFNRRLDQQMETLRLENAVLQNYSQKVTFSRQNVFGSS